MTVTLRDIADRVGKSVPTVSRALAGYEDIALDTRQQVQKVALEMGYVPNITARQLQKQRTDSIALILPSTQNLRFSDPFFSQFLSGIVEQTSQHGFELLISTTPTSGASEAVDTYFQFIRSRKVDGFIVVRTEREDARIKLLLEQKVPFVAFGRTEDWNEFSFVDEDGFAGMEKVVDHLVALGHRRLACIAEPTHFTKSFHRVNGFRAGLQKHGLTYYPELFVETRFRQRSGRLAANQLLSLPEPPTAIVACNDLLAIGALQAAQELGLQVGKDVSITGFDDIVMAEMTTPGLTTVHQPAHEMGVHIAEILIGEISGNFAPNRQAIFDPNLIVRESTGLVPTP